MMKYLTASALALGLMTLAGCDLIARDGPNEVVTADVDAGAVEAGTPELPERPEASEGKANIDWSAARADLAMIPSDERDGAFQVASGGQAPPVPVLLPSGIVIPAGAETQVRFQPLADGYFASYPGVAYDIIVNGTNEVIGQSARADDGVDKIRFQATASGAQVALSRYGADYLVEFECNDAEGEEADCVSEDEALDVARKLVIAGTR